MPCPCGLLSFAFTDARVLKKPPPCLFAGGSVSGANGVQAGRSVADDESAGDDVDDGDKDADGNIG